MEVFCGKNNMIYNSKLGAFCINYHRRTKAIPHNMLHVRHFIRRYDFNKSNSCEDSSTKI